MVENYIINETNHCGCCPECGTSWDNGEVVDYLMNEELYLGATTDREAAEDLARRVYNWTPENKKRISKLVFIEASDGDITFNGVDGYYQCPDCQIAWNSSNGIRTDIYKSILDNHSATEEFLKNNFPNHYKK